MDGPTTAHPVRRIGIVAGSGPEAGIDLWSKVQAEARWRAGPDYSGDLAAPGVHVVSEPALGLSMDMERNYTAVLHALHDAIARLGDVGPIGIACNTLNVLADELEAAGVADLVRLDAVVLDHVRSTGVDRVGLLAARPVAELGRWSVHRKLPDVVEVVVPRSLHRVHALIAAVKRHGPDAEARGELASIVAGIDAPLVLLACTELPLLVRKHEVATPLVDVTDLLATRLVESAGASR